MNFIIDIFKALFGTTAYQYQVKLITQKSPIKIEAEDFLDAEVMARLSTSQGIAFIEPLEDVEYSKGERGANAYLFKVRIDAYVVGESKEQALLNAKQHMVNETIEVVGIDKPIRINKNHYTGE